MFEKATESQIKAAEKNLKTDLKQTADKVKQEFKEKLKNDKFFHDIVKNKIVNDSVHSIG